MSTKLKKRGKSILAEVSHISTHGLWVLVNDSEYMLSFAEYPWFTDAKLSAIQNVQVLHGTHLRWPMLDVDIELDSLVSPERYPLMYKLDCRIEPTLREKGMTRKADRSGLTPNWY
jgi:hypothetical protein